MHQLVQSSNSPKPYHCADMVDHRSTCAGIRICTYNADSVYHLKCADALTVTTVNGHITHMIHHNPHWLDKHAATTQTAEMKTAQPRHDAVIKVHHYPSNGNTEAAGLQQTLSTRPTPQTMAETQPAQCKTTQGIQHKPHHIPGHHIPGQSSSHSSGEASITQPPVTRRSQSSAATSPAITAFC